MTVMRIAAVPTEQSDMEPSSKFLIELAKSLSVAKYPNVAGHLCAGLLWAIWPEWFDKNWRQHEPDTRSPR
jgi:hypothetical protein